MSFDYLPDTNIYLKQRKDMFRVNTDTHLLGNFMLVKKNESVLDIGTNNGALLDIDYFGEDRTVDTHIKMLRHNLGPYRDFIVTVRGMGYKFEA